jgi:hypothetical protein
MNLLDDGVADTLVYPARKSHRAKYSGGAVLLTAYTECDHDYCWPGARRLHFRPRTDTKV